MAVAVRILLMRDDLRFYLSLPFVVAGALAMVPGLALIWVATRIAGEYTDWPNYPRPWEHD